MNSINDKIDEDKVLVLLNKLSTDTKLNNRINKRKKSIVQPNVKKYQSGGFLLHYLQSYLLRTYGWSWTTYSFIGVLEIIDIGLTIASSIYGLQTTGFIIDIISIIYSFLRLDWLGIVGSIISIIPLIGDIVGGFFSMTGIFFRISKYFKYADEVSDAVKFGKRYDEDIINVMRYGIHYQDNIEPIKEILKFTIKYGNDGYNILVSSVNNKNITDLITNYGSEVTSLSKFIIDNPDLSNDIITIGEYGLFYGDDSLKALEYGIKYGDKAIIATSKAIEAIQYGQKNIGKYVNEQLKGYDVTYDPLYEQYEYQ
jgi:hypothetical protein